MIDEKELIKEIKKLNEKGYSIEFCECYNSVDIKVYGHNRNIEKTIHLSGYGYYSENDYIYALQEIMVEIGLEEERDKKIKLKQWEKDLLMVFYNFTDNVKLTLNNAIIITPMLRAGYFQGVPNTSMTIKDILDNCEVIGDD